MLIWLADASSLLSALVFIHPIIFTESRVNKCPSALESRGNSHMLEGRRLNQWCYVCPWMRCECGRWRQHPLDSPGNHLCQPCVALYCLFFFSFFTGVHVLSHNIRCLKEFSDTFRPKLVSRLISEE